MRWNGGSVIVDKVVAAVGRRPNVDDLGLETLGVPLDEKGMREVDAMTMRIGTTPVLLAGDANGDKPLLHEAADAGHIAGLNATTPRGTERRKVYARRAFADLCNCTLEHTICRLANFSSSPLVVRCESVQAR